MEITKQELEEIYYNNTNKKTAKILKISTTTLNKHIKRAGITFKGRGKGSAKKFKLKII
jgi:DNA-binding NtrC family response regulator